MYSINNFKFLLYARNYHTCKYFEYSSDQDRYNIWPHRTYCLVCTVIMAGVHQTPSKYKGVNIAVMKSKQDTWQRWWGRGAGTILDWVDRDSVPEEDGIWRETWMEWGSEFCNELKKAFQDIRKTNINALMLEHSWHIPWNQEGQVSVVETMREGGSRGWQWCNQVQPNRLR